MVHSWDSDSRLRLRCPTISIEEAIAICRAHPTSTRFVNDAKRPSFADRDFPLTSGRGQWPDAHVDISELGLTLHGTKAGRMTLTLLNEYMAIYEVQPSNETPFDRNDLETFLRTLVGRGRSCRDPDTGTPAVQLLPLEFFALLTDTGEWLLDMSWAPFSL